MDVQLNFTVDLSGLVGPLEKSFRFSNSERICQITAGKHRPRSCQPNQGVAMCQTGNSYLWAPFTNCIRGRIDILECFICKCRSKRNGLAQKLILNDLDVRYESLDKNNDTLLHKKI